MIETICPNCGNIKNFDEKHLGRMFKCPQCTNPVKIISVGSQINIEPTSKNNSLVDEVAITNEHLNNSSDRKKGNSLFLFLLLFISVGSIAIYFYLKNTSEDPLNQNSDISSSSIDTTSSQLSNIQNNSINEISSNGDYVINDELAESQLKKFHNAVMNNRDYELYNLLSNISILQYMKLINISKDDVVADKRNFAKKWELNSVSYYDFKRINNHDFTYTIKSKLTKTEDPSFEKLFLIKGTIGFDAEGKINMIIDDKTIDLNTDNPTLISDLSEISESSWIFNGDAEPFYITFRPDGTLEKDLINDDTFYWTIENSQLVWGKTGFSNVKCSIENGNLSCVASNNNGIEFNLVGYRKNN